MINSLSQFSIIVLSFLKLLIAW
uniref:Uncharacterized protein n=1 Tax=Arundo donax TaxID=35708 RepID=A0A0A9HEE1_ARUDO